MFNVSQDVERLKLSPRVMQDFWVRVLRLKYGYSKKLSPSCMRNYGINAKILDQRVT